MRDSDYITILSPMVNQLGLSGNSLIIFALIHGFSKDGEHHFSGSLDYISKWTNISKQSVINNIRQLVEMGFVNKFERIENGVRFCSYSTNYDEIIGGQKTLPLVKKLEQGSQKTLMGGSQKTLPNIDNKYIDKDIDIIRETKSHSSRFVPPTVEEVREYCDARRNGIDPESFVDFYSAKGWMIGSNKMKDWKAAVRTWEKRGNFKGQGAMSGKSFRPEKEDPFTKMCDMLMSLDEEGADEQ